MGAGLILIINHFNFRHMHAVVLIILICYKLIINRAGGGFLPLDQSLLVSVPLVLVFLFLCQTFQRKEFFLIYVVQSIPSTSE